MMIQNERIQDLSQALPHIFWHVLEGDRKFDCDIENVGTLSLSINDLSVPRVNSSGSLEVAYYAEDVERFLKGIHIERYLRMEQHLTKNILHSVFKYLLQSQQEEWIHLSTSEKVKVVFNKIKNSFELNLSGFEEKDEKLIREEVVSFLSHDALKKCVKQINPLLFKRV